MFNNLGSVRYSELIPDVHHDDTADMTQHACVSDMTAQCMNTHHHAIFRHGLPRAGYPVLLQMPLPHQHLLLLLLLALCCQPLLLHVLLHRNTD